MENSLDVNNYVLKLNKDTMTFINTKDLKTCQKSLIEAIQLLGNCKDSQHKDKLLGITYNNLGCLYRKWKKPQRALKYLQQASQYEESALVDNTNRATTLLNICAIHSSMQQHESALSHCKQALDLLTPSQTPQVYIPTLVIAYHSTAVEYEFLKNYKISLDFYRMAYELALKELGKNHRLTLSIGSDLQNAEKTIEKKEVLGVVKELSEKSFVSNLRNRKIDIRKKMEKFWTKGENFKVLPYFGLKSVKERTSGSSLRKFGGQRANLEKSSVKSNLANESSFRIKSNSPLLSSFYRKRGMIALPESIRSSGIISGFSKYKSTKNQNEPDNEIISIQKNKSGSLKSKTLKLISEIEQIKNEIQREGNWKLLQNWLNIKINVDTVQALVRSYLLRKSMSN